MRGVPLRLEIGPKDVEKGSVMAARRDVPGKAGKSFLSMENIAEEVGELLEVIQAALLERATKFRDENIHDPKDYEEFKDTVQGGWAFSWWCGDRACEEKVQEETKATIRCVPLEQPGGEGTCIYCGKPAKEKAYFARAY